jgi:hypothetical protein
MRIYKMKREKFSFEEELHKICAKINSELKVDDVYIEESRLNIRFYNVNGAHYISIDNLVDLLSYYLQTSFNDILKIFLREMINIYSINENSEDKESTVLELCKLDQLTDHIFSLVQKRFVDIVKIEDETLFEKIVISPTKEDPVVNRVIEECPFEQNWVKGSDMNNILTNMYSANDFIDVPNSQVQNEENDKKYMGRGRCRVKQVNIKDRPFVCEYPECKRAFKRFEHLKRHNKMHTGERPYKCRYPGCMKCFSRSDNLAQHFKIHNVPTKSQSLTFRNYYEPNKSLD